MCTSVATFCRRSIEPMTTHSALVPSALFLILSLTKVEQEKKAKPEPGFSYLCTQGLWRKIKGLLKQCIHIFS